MKTRIQRLLLIISRSLLIVFVLAILLFAVTANSAWAQSPTGSGLFSGYASPTPPMRVAVDERGINGPLPISAYPRPKNDNGLGIHWSTHIYGQDDEVTDYFVNEIKDMGIKWVKFLNDQVDGRDYDYLVEQLVANDIMPVVRIYTQCNEPLDLGALGRMVNHYLPMGVYYYELYNEPDIRGDDGGWCDDRDQDAEYLAIIWASAAREIQARGGYPSLPSIFPIGKGIPGWEDSFFQQFLHAIKANGDTDILYRSWGALHNYSLNHPPGYPMDEVNLTGRPLTAEEIARHNLDEHQIYAINQARANQYEPGGYHVGDDPTLDVTGFQYFWGYHDQFVELFGFEIPLISTEGGATVGSCEDPRYPCVDEQTQMDWTLAIYEYMLDDAPAYYFNTCTWLIAQRALQYFGGTVWESNAWYHDLKGDHLPVVEALKNHPRKGEPRWDQKQANNWQQTPAGQATSQGENPQLCSNMSSVPTNQLPGTPSQARLADYHRPPNDNGRGVHYAPTILAQSPEIVDFLVNELVAMNVKWVKVMQGDIPKVEHEYLTRQLVAHDIEPILRIYKPYNEPYEHLSAMVMAARSLGVHYFELYNEPNISGFPGGWHNGEAISVDRILDLWIPAAEAIQGAGGYAGLPTLAVGGDYDDLRFLEAFLDGLIARDRTDLLNQTWLPLHNYFLNHPFDYPTDPVNLQGIPLSGPEIETHGLTPDQVQAINNARANARQPGGYYVGSTIYEDSNGFRKYEAYAQIFLDRFGYYIPIITTEGGAIAGDQQDPRYPPVTDNDVADLTLRACHAMLDDAPTYYFAFTPWLMANAAGSHWDAAWEEAAWYKIDGSTLPVVDALKADPRRLEIRDWSVQSPTQPSQPMTYCSPDQLTGQSPDDAPSTKIVPATGRGPAWEVTTARWQPAADDYPRLRVDVLAANGQRLAGQQIRVAWTSGWTMLVSERFGAYSASMPFTALTDINTISITDGSGQAVQARGVEGHDLLVTFRQVGP
jgi:hypothetical protein